MTISTQVAALKSIRPAMPRQRQMVLDFIRQNDGATDEQVALALGLRKASVNARRKELQNMGLVVDKGFRALSTAGKSNIVWVAA